MMLTMTKYDRPTIRPPARDHATFAQFKIAAIRRGSNEHQMIGEAMRLWLAAEQLREDNVEALDKGGLPVPTPAGNAGLRRLIYLED